MAQKLNTLRSLASLGLRALPTVVLTACTLIPTRPVMETHTYLLSLETVSDNPGAPSGSCGTATLLVNVPHAQAGFNTPRMAYLMRPHEVRYYASTQWAETPARMLLPLLAQALERSGRWRAVAQVPSPVRGDYRLDADNLALQQEFFSKPSRVRVTLRLRLIDLREQTVIAGRTFEIVEEAPTDDPYGGVVGANHAVARLLDQVSKWVTASLDEKPQRGR